MTKAELIAENKALRGRVAELERNGNREPFMQPGSPGKGEPGGEALQRVQKILAPISQGILEIDLAGSVLYGNPAYHKILGYGDGELIGTLLLDRTESEEERKSMSDFLSMMAKDQPSPTPYFATRRTKNGRIVNLQVDWNYQRDREGNLVGFTAVLTDLTERKRAEEALRKSEARLDAFFSNAPTGLALLDESLRYLKINETMARFNGPTPEEHVGKSPRDILPGEVGGHVKGCVKRSGGCLPAVFF